MITVGVVILAQTRQGRQRRGRGLRKCNFKVRQKSIKLVSLRNYFHECVA
jgi:hypothetical protein